MFVGMEHIMLSNHTLADEALNAANSMCDGDPLLMNERGVMAFNRGECVPVFQSYWMHYESNEDSYDHAASLFQQSLELAQVTQSSQKSWSTTYLNLGTCYRKLKLV
jgi:anaphase-promoting complex subunit 6